MLKRRTAVTICSSSTYSLALANRLVPSSFLVTFRYFLNTNSSKGLMEVNSPLTCLLLDWILLK